MLAALAGEHGLCMQVLQLEGRRASSAGGPCFNYQLHRCRGACVGAETADQHAARLRELLAPWLIPPWPHDSPVALIERNAARFREDIHVFDRWCWLGSVATLDAAQALARTEPRIFEADAARLALQALEGKLTVECVPLATAQCGHAASASS
jgi:DNA polymerase-3 subunit epsilon